MSAPEKKRRGDHGASAWSRSTRRKLTGMLLDRALGGDVAAAEALLRLHAEYGDWIPFPMVRTSNVAEGVL
jgi:hypothetical protein